MKIIIPIASSDPEIVKVYGTIKPLVKIGNSTLIELFVKNFKFQDEYVFLCRQKDLVETGLLDVLNKLKIKKKIISIKKNTSSTLETIKYAKNYIKKDESILIAHPDNINIFFSIKKIKSQLKDINYDGFLFAFNENTQTNTSETRTGRVIIKNGKIIEIIEKTIKTSNSLRLAGIYFFKSWKEYLKNSEKTLDNQLPINGRYFVSQVYNEYLKNEKKISLCHVKKHITFGLIAYIDEYNFWHKYFYKNIKKKLTQNFNFLNLIPSAGEGSRFIENNKDNFKPLVNVGNKFMISKAIESLPKSKNNAIIIREDHNRSYDFKRIINKKHKNLDIKILKNKTSGMATTCYEYLKSYKKKNPILISSCDYAVIFDEQKLKNLINFFNPDVIIWTFKNYPDARIAPLAYAYCEIKNGEVKNISEKMPISNTPHLDAIAQGIFYFKSKKIFMAAFKKMIKSKNKINNEYYVGNSINQLIQDGYTVVPFEVDQYICLGTPQDLQVYNFWYKYFNDKS